MHTASLLKRLHIALLGKACTQHHWEKIADNITTKRLHTASLLKRLYTASLGNRMHTETLGKDYTQHYYVLIIILRVNLGPMLVNPSPVNLP